jgi:glycine cleavage system H lipoate-binding protein
MVVFQIETPAACRVDPVNAAAFEKLEIVGKEPESSEEKGGWLVRVTVDEKGVGEFEGLS